MDESKKGEITSDEGQLVGGKDITGTDVQGAGFSSNAIGGGSDVSDKGVTNDLTGQGNLADTTGYGQDEKRGS